MINKLPITPTSIFLEYNLFIYKLLLKNIQ